MSSEGRVVERPLERSSCNGCGYGFHSRPLSREDRDAFYDDAYDLGLRDIAADRQRAQGYRRHIESFLERHAHWSWRDISIVEFGCGTGALLKSLVDAQPIARALGVEPAAKLAEVARADAGVNVTIREAFAESGGTLRESHDLCLSVNVIEHALDPVSFLDACKTSIAATGRIVIICPDGNDPSSELLFRDHVSSFSVNAFALIAARVGLRLLATEPLSGQQSGFRIFLLQSSDEPQAVPRSPQESLSSARNSYLAGWSEIESATLAALGGRTFSIFGTGEYADLLKAYCPQIADGAAFYVADTPGQSQKDGREIVATDEFLRRPDTMALAAVNPRSWAALQQRFEHVSDRFVHPYQFCSLRSKL